MCDDGLAAPVIGRFHLNLDGADFQRRQPGFTLGRFVQFYLMSRAQRRDLHLIEHLVPRAPTDLPVALRRAAILMPESHSPLVNLGNGLLGIHKNVINVGFTVRETHDLRVGTFRRQLAGIAVTFQPAKTFLPSMGVRVLVCVFCFYLPQAIRGCGQILGADNTQGHAIGRQRQLHMMIKAELFCGTQAAGILWRMSRIIENRRSWAISTTDSARMRSTVA